MRGSRLTTEPPDESSAMSENRPTHKQELTALSFVALQGSAGETKKQKQRVAEINKQRWRGGVDHPDAWITTAPKPAIGPEPGPKIS